LFFQHLIGLKLSLECLLFSLFRKTSVDYGKTRRKVRWSRGRRGPSHHSSEIILRDNQLQNEPRMTETMGKRPRKQPIKCWGCEGDHMYRDFPHRGEKVRIVHNVQQVIQLRTWEEMYQGSMQPLDNKQVEFQSHMIEVEGKINDQPIAILIDSGASHSYLDPKMVERFHFPRSKLGKSWLVQLATGAKRKINEMVKDVQWT
jgi:hypothetical protein